MTVKVYVLHEETGRTVELTTDDMGAGYALECRIGIYANGRHAHTLDSARYRDGDEALNEAELHLEHGKCPHLGDA